MFAQNFRNLWKSKNFVDAQLNDLTEEYKRVYGHKWNKDSKIKKFKDAMEKSGLPINFYTKNGLIQKWSS
jgi:hypothetical protein